MGREAKSLYFEGAVLERDEEGEEWARERSGLNGNGRNEFSNLKRVSRDGGQKEEWGAAKEEKREQESRMEKTKKERREERIKRRRRSKAGRERVRVVVVW